MHKNYAIELIKQGKYEEARQVAQAHKIILNHIQMIELLEEDKQEQRKNSMHI